jgi:hypothetical protein
MAARLGRRALPAAAAGCAVILLAGVARGASPAPGPPACAPGTIATFFATTRLGVVDLYLFGASGARVTFFECVGDRAVKLGTRTASPTAPFTRMSRASTWHCGRLVRRFAATAVLADGSIVHGAQATRTRSCAQRFDLAVPRRLAPGALARVRVADRWRVGGVGVSLCVAGPGRPRSCRRIVLAPGKPLALRAFRVAARGRWRVELRVAGHTARAAIAVGVPAGTSKRSPPTLLATGDSTMDPLASLLSDRLGDEARVVSEAVPALSISKEDAFAPLAVSQVARLKPHTTVVSIGANEGWDMRVADGVVHTCCDAAWTDEYVRRARGTMLTYGRRVFWLTVVAQRGAARSAIVDAVNGAILRAAVGLPEVHVVRLDLLLSPDGYRDVIRYRGRDVRVRDPDGIHLNVAGARIAARDVVAALHAAGGG